MYSNFIKFLYLSYIYDVSSKSLINDQYEMAKKGISWSESNLMSDFERYAIINLIAEEYKENSKNILNSLNGNSLG